MFVEFAIATSTFAAIIAENIQKAITQDPQSFGLSPRSWEGVPDGGLPLVPPFDLILTDPIARVFLRSRVVQQMPMMMGGRPPPPQLRSDLMGDDTRTPDLRTAYPLISAVPAWVGSLSR